MLHFKTMKRQARHLQLLIPLSFILFSVSISAQAEILNAQGTNCPFTENGQLLQSDSRFGNWISSTPQNRWNYLVYYMAYDWLTVGNSKPQPL